MLPGKNHGRTRVKSLGLLIVIKSVLKHMYRSCGDAVLVSNATPNNSVTYMFELYILDTLLE